MLDGYTIPLTILEIYISYSQPLEIFLKNHQY